MASPAIDNPPPIASGESKSARKKKAKAEEAANGVPAIETPAQETQPLADVDVNGTSDHPHIRELQKQIRNVNKKLSGLSKTDAIIAENPGLSLDQLVAQKKMNADQKASAEKKPQLLAQSRQLEDQIQIFKAVSADFTAQLQKQKEDLTSAHAQELEKVKQEASTAATSADTGELRSKLLIFSQFLRAAAAKRSVEESDAGSDENLAFEGALLLVYGGDDNAVEAAINLIDGSDEQVLSTEGVPLPIKCERHCFCSIETSYNTMLTTGRLANQKGFGRTRPLRRRRGLAGRRHRSRCRRSFLWLRPDNHPCWSHRVGHFLGAHQRHLDGRVSHCEHCRAVCRRRCGQHRRRALGRGQ